LGVKITFNSLSKKGKREVQVIFFPRNTGGKRRKRDLLETDKRGDPVRSFYDSGLGGKGSSLHFPPERRGEKKERPDNQTFPTEGG